MMRVIIIGGGKTVYFLTKQFAGKGYHTTIINQDPTEARRLSRQLGATVVLGDGSDPAILEEAGARQVAILVSLLSHDEDNLIACQIAHQVFGVPRTIALINDPENESVFQKLGVSVAVSAAQIIATMIEEEAGFEEIMNLMSLAKGRVNVIEVALVEGSPAIDKTLMELQLPKNSLVATIIRGDEVIIPRGVSRLALFDRLVLICQPQNHEEVLSKLTNKKL